MPCSCLLISTASGPAPTRGCWPRVPAPGSERLRVIGHTQEFPGPTLVPSAASALRLARRRPPGQGRDRHRCRMIRHDGRQRPRMRCVVAWEWLDRPANGHEPLPRLVAVIVPAETGFTSGECCSSGPDALSAYGSGSTRRYVEWSLSRGFRPGGRPIARPITLRKSSSLRGERSSFRRPEVLPEEGEDRANGHRLAKPSRRTAPCGPDSPAWERSPGRRGPRSEVSKASSTPSPVSAWIEAEQLPGNRRCVAERWAPATPWSASVAIAALVVKRPVVDPL